MATKNPFTKIGRPKAIPTPHPNSNAAKQASPTDGFRAEIPGAAFRRGGSVGGFKPMPKYRDK